MRLELKILDGRLADWGFPHWGSEHAAGLDLFACLQEPLALAPSGPAVLVPAGISIHIGDSGWCGVIAPRSGLGHRGLVLGNTVGVIDADYTGAVMISAWNRNPAGSEGGAITISPGERIAQMVFVRVARPNFAIVEAFSGSSLRGEGGFGSTGSGPCP